MFFKQLVVLMTVVASFLAGRCDASNYQLQIVAKPGDVIDGKLLQIVIGNPVINNSGAVAFIACYSGGCGIFTQKTLIAATGDVIDGKTLLFFPGPTAINNSSEVAFLAAFQGGMGIFVKKGGHGKLVVATGDVIGGKTITNLVGGLKLNNSGLVVFNAQYVDSGPFFGFFTPEAPIAIVGETLIEGHLLLQMDLDISLNDAGTVVFTAGLDGIGNAIVTQNTVLFQIGDIVGSKKLTDVGASPSNSDSSVVFAASFVGGSGMFTQKGPAALIGETIGGTTLTGFLLKPVVNNRGEIAFIGNAFLPGTGVFTQNDLVVAPGNVVGGQLIANILFAPPGLNDRGQIAVNVSFSDGTSGMLLATRAKP